MMASLWGQVREWLFGSTPARPRSSRAAATGLIDRIAFGGLRGLTDDQLMSVVDFILGDPGLRNGLRGSVRFLDSVARRWGTKGEITPRQRQGVLNVLERAYPHNIAAELRRLS